MDGLRRSMSTLKALLSVYPAHDSKERRDDLELAMQELKHIESLLILEGAMEKLKDNADVTVGTAYKVWKGLVSNDMQTMSAMDSHNPRTDTARLG